MNSSFRNTEEPIRESPGESTALPLPGDAQLPEHGNLDSLPGTGTILAYVWMFSVLLGFFVLRIVGSQTFQVLLSRWKTQ